MDFTGTARALVGGLKTFTNGDAREALEVLDRGLTTVDHGLRVVNSVIDTFERGAGIARDVVANFHHNFTPNAPDDIAPHAGQRVSQNGSERQKTAAERGDELLQAAKEDALFKQMAAQQQAMARRTQGLISISQDRLDAYDRLRRGGSSGGFARR